mgnify:FL=1
MILTIAVAWMIVLLAVSAVTMLRAQRSYVRILALDTMTLIMIGVLVLYAARQNESYYLDAALILALLSFISTIAAVRYRAVGRPY